MTHVDIIGGEFRWFCDVCSIPYVTEEEAVKCSRSHNASNYPALSPCHGAATYVLVINDRYERHCSVCGEEVKK